MTPREFGLSPEYLKVKLAMLTGKQELGKKVNSNQRVILDNPPVNFQGCNTCSVRDQSLWTNLQEITFQKGDGGVKVIEQALDNSNENEMHFNNTMQAFSQGKKPPKKISYDERIQICQLISEMNTDK